MARGWPRGRSFSATEDLAGVGEGQLCTSTRAAKPAALAWEPLLAFGSALRGLGLDPGDAGRRACSVLPSGENQPCFCWGVENRLLELSKLLSLAKKGGVHSTVLFRSAAVADAWKKYQFLCYMPCSFPAPFTLRCEFCIL